MSIPKPPGYWSLKRIKESRDKFKTVRDWYENEPGAYAAASRLKILPELTKNLKKEIVANDYYDSEKIKYAIKDFKSFKQWLEEDKKTYAAAQRRGLLDDKNITGHLIKAEGKPISKWTKKAVLKDALLDDSRSAWKLRSPAAYRASRDRGYFEEAVSHMTLIGNKYKRCIYSIEIKGKNKIYIGLSQNFKTRMNTHLKSKRFKNYKKDQLIMTQLTEYIDREEAAQYEENLIIKKKEEGYELLNLDRGGGLGGMTLEWTKDKVLDSAKKEKHKVRWKENEPGAYAAAMNGGYLKEAVAHMEVLNPKGKWSNKKDVLADAKKFKYRHDWQDSSVGAYEAAKNNGWFEEAVAHMTRPDMTQKWTKGAVKKEAKKYKFKSDFNNNAVGAYEAAKNKGWFDEVTAHMGNKKAIPIKWNKKAVLDDAKKYKKKSQWKKNSPGAYGASHKGGFYKEATSHMK